MLQDRINNFLTAILIGFFGITYFCTHLYGVSKHVADDRHSAWPGNLLCRHHLPLLLVLCDTPGMTKVTHTDCVGASTLMGSFLFLYIQV